MQFHPNGLPQSKTAALAPIPNGVADAFWREALSRRNLEATLLDVFRSWGYGDVISPTFEYADTLSVRASAELQKQMYRFLDRDGRTLALRPDMTIAVARLVGTRLYDWPMPQRFCYAGSVFRYVEPQAGRQREFGQAGVELIGAGAPGADAEVVALTVKALLAAGLHDFQIVLGQMGFFHGLLEELDLDPTQTERLRQAILRKSEPALEELLPSLALSQPQRETIEAWPQLATTRTADADFADVLDHAERLCLNATMTDALENLRAVYDALHAHSVAGNSVAGNSVAGNSVAGNSVAGNSLAGRIHLDLTEVQSLGYYTGVTFEVLAPGVGRSIGSGGRYDDLVQTFGPPQPAVGIALGLERILLAQALQDDGVTTPAPIAPDALVFTRNDAACLRLLDAWRAQGLIVAVELAGRAGEELASAARGMGARFALEWSSDPAAGFALTDTQSHQTQAVTADEARRILEEARFR